MMPFISPQHPYHHQVKETAEAWCLRLPPSTEQISFVLQIPDNLHFTLMLYDPSNQYLGEIMKGNHPLAYTITLGDKPSCHFATTVSPLPTSIRFHLLTDPDSFPPEGYTVTLSCHLDNTHEALGMKEPLVPLLFSGPKTDTSKSAASTQIPGGASTNRLRYYKGDLHGHTTLSDGRLTPQAAVAVLVEQGLEFMAFTEHNRVAQWFSPAVAHLIPSVELTFPQGHVNIHGLSHADVLGPLSKMGSCSLADLVQWNAYGNAHVCVNHPFMEPWHFTDETLMVSHIHSLEILCDPTYSDGAKANKQAVAFWDDLWRQGYRVFGVGGSDSHELPSQPYEGATLPSLFGDPATHVAASSLTTASLIESLQQGHVFVSRYAALALDIQPEGILPGSAVPADTPCITWQVTVTNFDAAEVLPVYQAVVYLNGAPYYQQRLTPQHPTFIICVPVTGETGYTRISLLDENQHLHAFTNPVHWGSPQPPDRPLGHLIKEFLRRDQRHSV